MTYLRASSLVVALALAGGTAAAYAQTGGAPSNSTAGGGQHVCGGWCRHRRNCKWHGRQHRQRQFSQQRPGHLAQPQRHR